MPAETQSHGEAHREEKVGHDRVGVAAIRVMVQQHGRHPSVIAAEEIDKDHSSDGVATELVQRR